MARKVCDMHSHILPGVDDGAVDLEETMQALRMAADQGIRIVIATPHYYPEKYENSAEKIIKVCREVQQQCRKEKLDIRLYPGQECFYYSGLSEKLDRGEVLTMAGSKYVLVEFLPSCPYVQLLQGMTQLQQSGYYPILAHIERYECLEKTERLYELKNRGILLQMNFDTFLHKKNWFQNSKWQKLLQDGVVDLVGSDCHGTHFRPYNAKKSINWIEKNVKFKIRRKILAENVKKILREE